MSFQLQLLRADKLAKVLQSRRLVSALLRFGVLAGVEHRAVFSSDLATVVDIGANRGQFALAAREYAPQARIISFEPLPGPAAIFRRVFARDPMVTLHEKAVGPKSGEADIHVAAADDSSSLLPMALQTSLFPGSGECGTAQIRVARLADCLSCDEIRPPALLKLDVQGYELQALRGCEELLDRSTWIYAECSFVELYAGQALADEVIAWLRDRNFFLSGVYNVYYGPEGKAVQGDFLFQADREH